MLAPSTGGLAPPPSGNPGSAPEAYIDLMLRLGVNASNL